MFAMLCVRILWMIHFKVQEKPKKSVLHRRDKFVWRLVGNQCTAPGCIEGKPFKSSQHFELVS